MSGYPDGYEPRLFLAKAVQELGANVTFDNPATVVIDGEEQQLPGFHVNGKRIIYLLDNRMPYLHWQTAEALQLSSDPMTYVFCAQKRDADQYECFHWLPLAVTPGYIHKRGIPSYDFSFVGYLNDEPRKALMERIQEQFTHNIQSGVFAAEAIDVYISGRVGLNIPAYVGGKYAYDVNMRVFEIPALKVPLLTADVEGMADLGFRHGVNCLMYRSGVELERFMELLIVNDLLRESIADKGYQLVTREHTYRHRAQQLLSILEG
jgi:hypothetical protein